MFEANHVTIETVVDEKNEKIDADNAWELLKNSETITYFKLRLTHD